MAHPRTRFTTRPPMSTFPPMPWRLRVPDVAVATLHWVGLERARRFVPRGMRILSPWPGRTVGGLFVAGYGPGSDLRYNELIASCATIWYRGRPAVWATHLFVDNPDSVAGGRALLGVPKVLASFTREAGERTRVRVGDAENPICRISHGRPRWLWRQRVRIGALNRDVRDGSGRTVQAFGNEVRGRVGVVRAEVEIAPGSPLAELGLGGPLFSVCGTELDAVFGGAPYLPQRALSVSPDAG